MILALACLASASLVAAFAFGAILGTNRRAAHECPICNSVDSAVVSRLYRCEACGIIWDLESGKIVTQVDSRT